MNVLDFLGVGFVFAMGQDPGLRAFQGGGQQEQARINGLVNARVNQALMQLPPPSLEVNRWSPQQMPVFQLHPPGLIRQ